MYIQSFHMDGFGIFSDVSVENLSPGLSIFLGENEAGKSTCLEFLRTMLIGYPDPRNKEYKRIPGALRGGQPGGSMDLYADDRGLLRLTRRPGSNGGVLTLTDAQGKPLEPDMLRQMLSGVSRDVYRNVFGFSLTELEDLNSLTDEGVRNALYGASFGPGLRSPGEALKLLDKQADEIFKSGGSKPALNAAMRQRRSDSVLVGVLERLKQYTVKHFATEEEFFDKFGYPDSASHKKAHHELVQKVLDFEAELKSGRAKVTMEIMRFLKD